MADTVHSWAPALQAVAVKPAANRSLHRFMRRRSTTALLMCLPLIVIVLGLIVYPAFYSIYLSMLNKTQTRFIGLGNFAFLMSRDTFWMVVEQSAIFALSAVFFKALIGLITGLGFEEIPWLSQPLWARFSVILVNVWYGAPFFLIMYLAALKSVPEQLYEAASIDGASAWQKFVHITLPMMRNIIAITVLFSLIITFANFDIVQIMTAGGPRNMTHVFATYSFMLGIRSGDLPLGAATSLFMLQILAIAAVFILRGVRKRGREIG